MTPAPAPEHADRTVAIVLAAGAGRRFEGPTHKLAARVGGRPLARIAVDAALAARIGPVVVVQGAHPLDDDLGDRLEAVRLVHNPDWFAGQITSVWAGIHAAEQLGAGAVVIGLADQPFVSPDAWRAVAASDAPIAVATYDGRRGNPVRLDASIWPLLPHEGDHGARTVIDMRPDLVEPVPCPGSAADIDTLEDLERWQSNS